MSRPKVADDRTDRLEQLVDAEADLPASALSFDEKLEYLLDVYETRGDRIDHLGDVVDNLERKLEEQEEDTSTPTSSPGGRSSGSFGR